MKRKDPLTGEEFVPTRTNQIFANRQNQIRYNNEKARELRNRNQNINTALSTNFKILEQLLWGGKETTVHKEFLKGRGYNFGVWTHVVEYQGSHQYAIYQFVLVMVGDDRVKIVRL